jgi:hypothetical protein
MATKFLQTTPIKAPTITINCFLSVEMSEGGHVTKPFSIFLNLLNIKDEFKELPLFL